MRTRLLHDFVNEQRLFHGRRAEHEGIEVGQTHAAIQRLERAGERQALFQVFVEDGAGVSHGCGRRRHTDKNLLFAPRRFIELTRRGVIECRVKNAECTIFHSEF